MFDPAGQMRECAWRGAVWRGSSWEVPSLVSQVIENLLASSPHNDALPGENWRAMSVNTCRIGRRRNGIFMLILDQLAAETVAVSYRARARAQT